ncbi:MAG TPA: polymer-forming cytoskeletal protein [Chitinophagaceae bacterium]|jgi:cytoskeletal protein CcmA (bactofilin family)|nr:polymer-forming cytoskeletal protein [Chitinophagaceae bacterium]
MLNHSKKTTEETQLPGKTSIIGAGMLINGQVTSEGDIRIDGHLTGTVKSSSKLVVGEDGLVEGDVIAYQVDVTGKITGNIIVKDLLTLRGHAIIEGDINAGKISMEPTVSFNGTCTMQAGNVVEMTSTKDERKKAAE